jgi:hypothetical protein
MKRLASPILAITCRASAGSAPRSGAARPAARLAAARFSMVSVGLMLLSPLAGTSGLLGGHGGRAWAQGQELAPIKVDLPPQPNFNVTNAPETYPTGEMSVYGLRKHTNQNLDKDVQVKAYLTEIYECPPEQRKCNDELAAKNKKAAKAKAKLAGKAPRKGKGKAADVPAPDAPAAATAACRPCDQPHFFMSDSPAGKKERALLVADYPVKDWKTGKPKALTAKTGEQYVVTGTFAINSIGGFAASDGLIIHKKLVDAKGAVVTEGNAVLPPDAQDIKLDGKVPEKVGAGRIDAKK